jgi:hypothetical protein
MATVTNDDEARRDAACRAFWSDEPLNLAYRQEIADQPFSLKEFVSFVLAMPSDKFSSSVRDT